MLPVRFTFYNNYFNFLYHGIHASEDTKMVAILLEGIEITIGVDYLENNSELDAMGNNVVYTSVIDAHYEYKLGNLE